MTRGSIAGGPWFFRPGATSLPVVPKSESPLPQQSGGWVEKKRKASDVPRRRRTRCASCIVIKEERKKLLLMKRSQAYTAVRADAPPLSRLCRAAPPPWGRCHGLHQPCSTNSSLSSLREHGTEFVCCGCCRTVGAWGPGKKKVTVAKRVSST